MIKDSYFPGQHWRVGPSCGQSFSFR